MFSDAYWYIERIEVLVIGLALLTLLLIVSTKRKNALIYNIAQGNQPLLKRYQYVIFLSRICVLLAVCMLFLASSGISKIYKTDEIELQEDSLLFALDISPSMSVRDINSESRMNVLIHEIDNFFKSSLTKEVALMLFADNVNLAVPFTTDYAYISSVLKKVQLGSLGNGTALAEALLYAYNLYYLHPNRNIHIAVFTDGNSNSGKMSLTNIEEYIGALATNVSIVHIGNDLPAPFSYFDEDRNAIISGVLEPVSKDKIKDFSARTLVSYSAIDNTIDLKKFFLRLFNIKTSSESRLISNTREESLTNRFLLYSGLFFLLFLFFRHVVLRSLW